MPIKANSIDKEDKAMEAKMKSIIICNISLKLSFKNLSS